jgi:hypothetical protein
MNESNKKMPTSETGGNPKAPRVNWDDSHMSTSYANVVNAVSSREEFTLFFGTNQTWNAQDSEFRVKLSDRVILNPHAAKRLLTLLAAVMREYEKRFGVVNIDLAAQPEVTATPPAGGQSEH